MKKFPFKQESLLQTTFKKKIYFLLSALSSPFGINTLCRKPMSLLSSYLIPGNFQINSHAERTSTGSFGLSHSCSVWSVIAKYDISVHYRTTLCSLNDSNGSRSNQCFYYETYLILIKSFLPLRKKFTH